MKPAQLKKLVRTMSKTAKRQQRTQQQVASAQRQFMRERDALSPAMRASITREMYRLFDGKPR